jgi:hypothetical protein
MYNQILIRLGITGTIVAVTSIMDYDKTRDDVDRRRAELLERQQRIKEETKKLNDEAEQNKRELIGLDQILGGLDFVTSDVPPDEPIGVTDNIRKILTETTVPLVPTQIRDSLQARGIEGSSAKNLLINVHKVLDRLGPELVLSTTPEGKAAYRHRSARPLVSSPPVVDLMAALKKSLAEMEKKRSLPLGIGAVVQGGTATDAPESHHTLPRMSRKTYRRARLGGAMKDSSMLED